MKYRTRYEDRDARRTGTYTAETHVGAVGREVAVPVLWCILLSTAYSLAAALAALAVKIAFGLELDWWGIPLVGLAVWIATLTWRLTLCEADRREILLYPLETALGQDLNRDGYVGAPGEQESRDHVPGAEPRIIYVHDYAHRQFQQGARDFRFWLREVYNGRGTAWRAWEGADLPSGGIVGRPQWESWTARLLEAGLATRSYPTAPLSLTGDYRQALESLRELL